MKSELLQKIQEAASAPENMQGYLERIKQVSRNTDMYNYIGLGIFSCWEVISKLEEVSESLKTDSKLQQMQFELRKLTTSHATSNVIRLGGKKSVGILFNMKEQVSELHDKLLKQKELLCQ